MTLLGPALMMVFLAQAEPVAAGGVTPMGERFRLTSERQSADDVAKVTTAQGNVVLSTEGLVLKAEELRYFQEEGRAEATGNVLLISNLGVAMADHVSVDLTTQVAVLSQGVFLQKADVSPEALASAQTADEVARLGRTTLSLDADRLERLGPNELRVEGLSFTPCDCDPANPSWRISASSADIMPGERAILRGSLIYVHRVPVLWLPYVYLPLADRRSGLLRPKPAFSSQNGFSYEQPVFLTLGRSYDITFTPGYIFGGGGPRGVRGPRLHTEFRYASSPVTSGRVGLGLLQDLREVRDPVNPGLTQPGSERGLRGDLRVEHSSLWGGIRQRADVSLASDGYLPGDFSTDVIARETGYLRSTVSVSKPISNAYVGVHAIVRQDLRYGFPLFGGASRVVAPASLAEAEALGVSSVRSRPALTGGALRGYGEFTRSPPTMQELPSVHVYMPETRMGGPLRIGAHASYTRISPLTQNHADEGLDGVWSMDAPPPDLGQGNGIFDGLGSLGIAGESEARDRLSLRPSVSLPFSTGPLRWVPYGAYRSDYWIGEVTGDIDLRSYAVGGLHASSELSRIWGDATNGSRHAFVPEVEIRSSPFVWGGVPRAYDAFDAAVPPDGFTDAVAQLGQRLWLKRNGQVVELLRFDVGQGADLEAGRMADAFARAGFTWGPFSLNGTARYDVEAQRLAQIFGGASFQRPRYGAYVTYDNLHTFGGDPQRRSIERLVGGRAPGPRAPRVGDPALGQVRFGSRAQLVRTGVRVVPLRGLTSQYDVLLQPGALDVRQQPGVPVTPFLQHALTALYSPNCDCWTVGAYARFNRDSYAFPSAGPGAGYQLSRFRSEYGVIINIAGFGSFGAGSSGM